MSKDHDQPTGLLNRLMVAADRIDVTSPWIVRGAFVAFVIGAVAAVLSTDVTWSELRPVWLAATGLLSLPVIVLTATEYRAIGRIVGQRVAMRPALDVSVVAGAANLLPLPGGVVMRAQSLRKSGVPRRKTFAAQLALAFTWLAVSALASAPLLAPNEPSAARVFALVGIGAAAAAVAVFVWLKPAQGIGKSLLIAASVEVLFVASAATRIAAAIASLGLTPTLTQAVVLTAATVLSAFVIVLPAGLGVREFLAAGIAPLVGLSPATGFLVATIVRIVSMAVFGLLAGLVTHSSRKR